MLNYQGIIPVLVHAIQELKIENNKLNNILMQKESDIFSLQTELTNYMKSNTEQMDALNKKIEILLNSVGTPIEIVKK